jgi:hypothetical protein
MDRRIMIGVGVASAVGIGAVALYFMTRRAVATEIDCSDIDFTQAQAKGKGKYNNPQWMDTNTWVLDSSYHNVNIYKGVGSKVGYFVWLAPWESKVSTTGTVVLFNPWPSSALSIEDVYTMIDQACGQPTVPSGSSGSRPWELKAPAQDWNHIL